MTVHELPVRLCNVPEHPRHTQGPVLLRQIAESSRAVARSRRTPPSRRTRTPPRPRPSPRRRERSLASAASASSTVAASHRVAAVRRHEAAGRSYTSGRAAAPLSPGLRSLHPPQWAVEHSVCRHSAHRSPEPDVCLAKHVLQCREAHRRRPPSRDSARSPACAPCAATEPSAPSRPRAAGSSSGLW